MSLQGCGEFAGLRCRSERVRFPQRDTFGDFFSLIFYLYLFLGFLYFTLLFLGLGLGLGLRVRITFGLGLGLG